jgi:2'-5' RNA ligase
MRLFVAVFPAPEVQRAAASVIESLRWPGDGVSWVKPDNLHYTLRFIGEVGEDGARRVAEAARESVQGRHAFEAVFGGVGAFPNARRARVIWLGMTGGAADLVSLARGLEDALAKRGFERESREFSAHLTLGRVREPREDWTAKLTTARVPEGQALRFRVERVVVVQSTLSPKGSIYSVREQAPLAP